VQGKLGVQHFELEMLSFKLEALRHLHKILPMTGLGGSERLSCRKE
jgi:hypothetical protein